MAYAGHGGYGRGSYDPGYSMNRHDEIQEDLGGYNVSHYRSDGQAGLIEMQSNDDPALEFASPYGDPYHSQAQPQHRSVPLHQTDTTGYAYKQEPMHNDFGQYTDPSGYHAFQSQTHAPQSGAVTSVNSSLSLLRKKYPSLRRNRSAQGDGLLSAEGDVETWREGPAHTEDNNSYVQQHVRMQRGREQPADQYTKQSYAPEDETPYQASHTLPARTQGRATQERRQVARDLERGNHVDNGADYPPEQPMNARAMGQADPSPAGGPTGATQKLAKKREASATRDTKSARAGSSVLQRQGHSRESGGGSGAGATRGGRVTAETRRAQETAPPKRTASSAPTERHRPRGTLVECTEGCGRTFKPGALEHHVKVCKKLFGAKPRRKSSIPAKKPSPPTPAEEPLPSSAPPPDDEIGAHYDGASYEAAPASPPRFPDEPANEMLHDPPDGYSAEVSGAEAWEAMASPVKAAKPSTSTRTQKYSVKPPWYTEEVGESAHGAPSNRTSAPPTQNRKPVAQDAPTAHSPAKVDVRPPWRLDDEIDNLKQRHTEEKVEEERRERALAKQKEREEKAAEKPVVVKKKPVKNKYRPQWNNDFADEAPLDHYAPDPHDDRASSYPTQPLGANPDSGSGYSAVNDPMEVPLRGAGGGAYGSAYSGGYGASVGAGADPTPVVAKQPRASSGRRGDDNSRGTGSNRARDEGSNPRYRTMFHPDEEAPSSHQPSQPSRAGARGGSAARRDPYCDEHPAADYAPQQPGHSGGSRSASARSPHSGYRGSQQDQPPLAGSPSQGTRRGPTRTNSALKRNQTRNPPSSSSTAATSSAGYQTTAGGAAGAPSQPGAPMNVDDLPAVAGVVSMNDAIMEEASAAPSHLVPCGVCGRKFNADRIDKHQNACASASQSRRPQFNTKASRMTSEAKQAARRADPAKPKQSNWREQREQLRCLIKASKGDGPMPTFNHVPCPHCGRSFNQTAAERHIPKCQSIINKPKTLVSRRGQDPASRVRMSRR
eukprot:Rmarinus@m.18382